MEKALVVGSCYLAHKVRDKLQENQVSAYLLNDSDDIIKEISEKKYTHILWINSNHSNLKWFSESAISSLPKKILFVSHYSVAPSKIALGASEKNSPDPKDIVSVKWALNEIYCHALSNIGINASLIRVPDMIEDHQGIVDDIYSSIKVEKKFNNDEPVFLATEKYIVDSLVSTLMIEWIPPKTVLHLDGKCLMKSDLICICASFLDVRISMKNLPTQKNLDYKGLLMTDFTTEFGLKDYDKENFLVHLQEYLEGKNV